MPKPQNSSPKTTVGSILAPRSKLILLLLFHLASSGEILRVQSQGLPPVIISEPKDGRAFFRSPLLLSVVVEGSEPLTYNWHIDERTHSLGTNATLNYPYSESGTHQFYVEVSNPFGTVKSRQINITFVMPNDDFKDAQLLEGYGNRIEGYSDATAEPGEPEHGGKGRSLWYRWIAPTNALVELSPQGYTTVVALYTGNSLTNLTAIGKVEYSYPNMTPIRFTAEAGREYHIALDFNRTANSHGGGYFLLIIQEIHINSIVYNSAEKYFLLSGPINDAYLIETSTNLINWTQVKTGVIPENGIVAYGIPNAKVSQRFYRARQGGE